MKNLDLLKRILTSGEEYWIVAKRNSTLRGDVKFKDSILFVCIPYSINVHLRPENILLSEVEKLYDAELPNVFINEPYAPFQHGQRLSGCYEGFPVKSDKKEFLIKALALQSDNLYDYKELADLLKETELVST